jgi:hypothetical protein
VQPGAALVAPGPRVTKQMPGPARELPVRLRHHGGAALLAADGDLDRRVVQGVEHGEEALAGHAEQVLHPVHHELVDEDLAAGTAIDDMGARGLSRALPLG